MDDLDHSVLIAEQDWDCFCAESEECSVQQVKLAVLDDSGLSDTDDDKTSINASSHPAQTKPSAKDKVCPAAECESEHTSENPEFTEHSDFNTEPAGETCDAKLNDHETTSDFFNLDHNKTNDESSPTELSTSVINNLGGNGESQGENKSSQANKSVLEASSQCNQDIMHENGTECTGLVTGLTDSSPVLKKEKERWFVTVNDSPVRLREKVGQKKKRKKKPSRNLIQQSGAIHKPYSSLNNNIEAETEIFEKQTMQHKLEQPSKSSTYLNSAHKENYLYGLHNIQDFQSFALTEPITDNVVHLINNTGEESPRFILGASTPTVPSDNEGEKTEQQEIFEQSHEVKEPSSSQETPCQESFSNRVKTSDALGPTRPIFAISAFWDEMEKLTINDILELRTAKSNSSLRESIISEECNSVDTVDAQVDCGGEVEYKGESVEDGGLVDDAEDSDYFTHVDDCKPDRSSCEFSTLSDYDEEFLQRLHGSSIPSPEPYRGKEQTQRLLESTCEKSLFQEVSEEIWPSYQSESNEIVRLYPESDLPLYMHSKTETQMQDILLTAQDNNMSSFLLNQCETRRSTPSPVLSMSDVLEDQCLMSLFKILNDTKSEQYRTRTPERHTSVVSFPFLQNLSVPETYDDFFSDFEIGNFLFPAVQGTTKCKKNMVPIYSSSRSVVRDLALPEVEEAIQSESEDKRMPIRVITHFSSQQRCESPSEMPNICFINKQRNTWRNLSLRRIKFSFLGSNWCRMATSWISPKTSQADTVFKENWNFGTSNPTIAQPKLPVLLLENQALGDLTEQQMHVKLTISEPDRDCFGFSLKQADMCLVCIAFASWVLKSTNPQSTDMWKAALLANVSAISAIQYLRHT